MIDSRKMSNYGLLQSKLTHMKPFSCEEGRAPYSGSEFAFIVDCKFSENKTMALFLFVVAAPNMQWGSVRRRLIKRRMKRKSPVLMNCDHKKHRVSKVEHSCIIVSLWFSEGHCFIF